MCALLGVRVAGGECIVQYRYPQVGCTASENGVWISRPSKAGNCAMQKPKNSQKLMLDSNPNLAMSYYVESPHDDISGSYSRITPRVEKVVNRLTCSI